ncbi:MAG: right-handed parallel beta-helix repeat-containing protein [Casimicrobiaceae bacterium]
MTAQILRRACIAFGLIAFVGASAHGALVQRTFVASTGLDTNPCSIGQPCRSFAAAMLNTAPDGEVIVLDSAGYGPVSIAQHVSIIAPPGIYAGISVPGPAAGVTINSARVVLEGLTINGTGGTVGVSATTGSEVYLNNCAISNVATAVDLDASQLFVNGTDVRDISAVGISAASASLAIVSRTTLVNSTVGVRTDNANVTIVESTMIGGTTGVHVGVSAGTTDLVAIYRSLIAGMSADGISVTAAGAGSTSNVDILGSTLTRNAGNGIAVSTTSPGDATVTVADSQLTMNGYAIQADLGTGVSATLSNRNTIAGNTLGGLKAINAGVIHTRGNNSGEQVNAVSGTTLVPGF